jgi:hypothetical protein
MLTKDEYIICAEHLISLINFNRVYDNCADVSKKKFYKDDIIISIKKMIRSYPHFDTSMKGRSESFTLLLSSRKGTFNDYMYFISGIDASETWYLYENVFLDKMKYLDDRSHNVVWFNMKEYLKGYKLNKLINIMK